MITALVFGLGAAGLWFASTAPPAPALERLVSRRAVNASHRTASGSPALTEQVGQWAARYPWGDWLRVRTNAQDLELLQLSAEAHVGAKLAFASCGFALPFGGVLILAAVGFRVPVAIPIWVALLGATLGFFGPDIDRANAASREREQLRHAVEDFAEITAYAFRSGVGVATALRTAADRVHGRFGEEVSTVLHEAQYTGTSPWVALDELGFRWGLPDLSEVAAAVKQAGADGASVGDSLEAKAGGLARRALAEREADAVGATTRMLIRSIALALCALAILYGPLLLRLRRL